MTMTGESMEAQIARMDERSLAILEELKASKVSRGQQYDTIEAIRVEMAKLSDRVGSVEKNFADAKPTLTEFVTIKNKVAGAGWLGRGLWILVAFLLGLAAKSREGLFHLFTAGPPSGH